jgi:hypothetical protein
VANPFGVPRTPNCEMPRLPWLVAERTLGRHATRRTGTMDEHMAAIGVLVQGHVAMANDDMEEARDDRKGIPPGSLPTSSTRTSNGPSPA